MKTARMRRKRRLAVMAVILSVSMIFNSVSTAYGAWNIYQSVRESMRGSSMGIRSWIYQDSDTAANRVADSDDPSVAVQKGSVAMENASRLYGKVQNTGGLNAVVRARVTVDMQLSDAYFQYLSSDDQSLQSAVTLRVGEGASAADALSIAPASVDETAWTKLAGSDYYYYKGKLAPQANATLFSGLTVDTSKLSYDAYLTTADSAHTKIYMLENGESFTAGGVQRTFTTNPNEVDGLVLATLGNLQSTSTSTKSYATDFGDVNGDGVINEEDAKITGDYANGHNYSSNEKISYVSGFKMFSIHPELTVESTQAIKGAPQQQWGLNDVQVASIYGSAMNWDSYDAKSDLSLTATYTGGTAGYSITTDQISTTELGLTDVVPGYEQVQRLTVTNGSTSAQNMVVDVYLDESVVRPATLLVNDAYLEMLSKIELSMYTDRTSVGSKTTPDIVLRKTALSAQAETGTLPGDNLTKLGSFAISDAALAPGASVTRYLDVRFNPDATTYYDGSAAGSMPNILLVAAVDPGQDAPVGDFAVKGNWGDEGYKDVAYRGITPDEILNKLSDDLKVTFVSDREGDGCTGHYEGGVIYIDTPEGVQAAEITPIYGNGPDGDITELIVRPYLMTQDVATNMPANVSDGDKTKYFKPSVVNEINVKTSGATPVSIVPNGDNHGGEIAGVLDPNGTVIIEGGYVDNQTGSPTYGSIAVPDGVKQVRSEVTYARENGDYKKDANGNLIIEKIKLVPVEWEGPSNKMGPGTTGSGSDANTTITINNYGGAIPTIVSDGNIVDNANGTVTFKGAAADNVTVVGGYVNEAGVLVVPEDVTKVTVTEQRDSSGTITGYTITYDTLATSGTGDKLTSPIVQMLDEDNKIVTEGPKLDNYTCLGDPMEVRGAVELLFEDTIDGQPHTSIVVTEGVTKAHFEPEYNRNDDGSIVYDGGVKSVEYVNVVPTQWAGTNDGIDKDSNAGTTTVFVKNMDGDTVELSVLGSGTVTGADKNLVFYPTTLFNNPSSDPDAVDITIDGGYRDQDGNIILPPGAKKADIEALYNDAGEITGFKVVVTEWEGDADRPDTRSNPGVVTVGKVIDEEGDTVTKVTYPNGPLTGTIDTETVVVEGGRVDPDGNIVVPDGVVSVKVIVEHNDPNHPNAITKIVLMHTEKEDLGAEDGKPVEGGALNDDGTLKIERRDGSTDNLTLYGVPEDLDLNTLLHKDVIVIGEEIKVGGEGTIYLPNGVIEAELVINEGNEGEPSTITVIPTRWQSDGSDPVKEKMSDLLTPGVDGTSTLTTLLRHQDRTEVKNVSTITYTDKYKLDDKLIITGGYLGDDGKIVLPDGLESANVRIARQTTDTTTGITTIHEITIRPVEYKYDPPVNPDQSKPFLIDRNNVVVTEVPGISETSWSSIAGKFTPNGNRTVKPTDLADDCIVIGAEPRDGQLIVPAGVTQARLDILETTGEGANMKITKLNVVPTAWRDKYVDGDTRVGYNNKIALNSSGRPTVVNQRGDLLSDSCIFPTGSFGQMPAKGMALYNSYVNDYNEIVVPVDPDDFDAISFDGNVSTGGARQLSANVRTSTTKNTNPIADPITNKTIPIVKRINGRTIADYRFGNVEDAPQLADTRYLLSDGHPKDGRAGIISALSTTETVIEESAINSVDVADDVYVYASAASGSTGKPSAHINNAGELIVPDTVVVSNDNKLQITYEVEPKATDGDFTVVAIHVTGKVTEPVYAEGHPLVIVNEKDRSDYKNEDKWFKTENTDERKLTIVSDEPINYADLDKDSIFEGVAGVVWRELTPENSYIIVARDDVSAVRMDPIYDESGNELLGIRVVPTRQTIDDVVHTNTNEGIEIIDNKPVVVTPDGAKPKLTIVPSSDESTLVPLNNKTTVIGAYVDTDGHIVVPEGTTEAEIMRVGDKLYVKPVNWLDDGADVNRHGFKPESTTTTVSVLNAGGETVLVNGTDSYKYVFDDKLASGDITVEGATFNTAGHLEVPENTLAVNVEEIFNDAGEITGFRVIPTRVRGDKSLLNNDLSEYDNAKPVVKQHNADRDSLATSQDSSNDKVIVVPTGSYTKAISGGGTVPIWGTGVFVDPTGDIIVPDGVTRVTIDVVDSNGDGTGTVQRIVVTPTEWTGPAGDITDINTDPTDGKTEVIVVQDDPEKTPVDYQPKPLDGELPDDLTEITIVGGYIDDEGHIVVPDGVTEVEIETIKDSGGKITKIIVTPKTWKDDPEKLKPATKETGSTPADATVTFTFKDDKGGTNISVNNQTGEDKNKVKYRPARIAPPELLPGGQFVIDGDGARVDANGNIIIPEGYDKVTVVEHYLTDSNGNPVLDEDGIPLITGLTITYLPVEVKHKLTTTVVGGHGSVSPTMTEVVEGATTPNIVVTPDSGYKVVWPSLTDLQNVVITGNTLTFTMPDHDVALNFSFVEDGAPEVPPVKTSDIIVGGIYTGLTLLELPIAGSDQLFVRDDSTDDTAAVFNPNDFEDYIYIDFIGGGSFENGHLTYPANTAAVKLEFIKDPGHDKYNRIKSTVTELERPSSGSDPTGLVINPFKTSGGLASNDSSNAGITFKTADGQSITDLTLIANHLDLTKEGTWDGVTLDKAKVSHSVKVVGVDEADGYKLFDVELKDGNLVFPAGTTAARIEVEDYNGDGEIDYIYAYITEKATDGGDTPTPTPTPTPVDPDDSSTPSNNSSIVRSSGSTSSSNSSKSPLAKTGDPMHDIVFPAILAAASGIGLLIVARALRRLDAEAKADQRRGRHMA